MDSWSTYHAGGLPPNFVLAESSGWCRAVGGVSWFVQHRDGTRREGLARTVAGAKSAITQLKRRSLGA